MMYNPQLDTFICVVEAGSFSKAAEELYISAPAVIKQINSLENSLNLQLFERTHRGLIITEAGKSLYQDAKYLIQYSKESLIRAQEAMNHNEEIIRVGISPMTPPEVFVELWPKIQKIYPEMKFKLITFENTPENAREILANMGKNIDVIAGIFDETMLELRGCDGTEISREPFCVAVSIHHRLAKKEKITLDDLAGENLMLMRRGWSYYGEKAFEYIFGERFIRLYRVLFIAGVMVGSMLKLEFVWNFSDLMNGMMAIPNLIALLLLSKVISSESKRYFESLK